MPRYSLGTHAPFSCAPVHRAVGYIAGTLFAIGWWLFIDAIHNHLIRPTIQDWIPGVLATLSMISINTVDRRHLSGEDYAQVVCAFASLTFSMSAIGYAVILFVVKYGGEGYVGLSLIAQSFLIFLSAMAYWGLKGSEDDSISLY